MVRPLERWNEPIPPAGSLKMKTRKAGPTFAPAIFHPKTADESAVAAAKAYFESHNPTLDEIKLLDRITD